jgi:hypothetical protein
MSALSNGPSTLSSKPYTSLLPLKSTNVTSFDWPGSSLIEAPDGKSKCFPQAFERSKSNAGFDSKKV